MDGPAWTMTEPFHRTPYPAISPSKPELSQAGKTVLVAGGNSGIGLAIAKAFVQASARKVIILGRSESGTQDAVKELSQISADTEVVGRPMDISSATAVDETWASLAKEGTTVDVLVLNAVKLSASKPLLEVGTEGIWQDFDMNVRAQLQMAERFQKQPGEGASGTKYLVNISSYAIHGWQVALAQPGYGLTKNAAALTMQLIAEHSPVEKMQIINMNPGGVLTRSAEENGYTKDSYPWNDAALPGQFTVWLASPEAAFLHGRFVWTEWDVDVLKSEEFKEKLKADPYYLKVGVKGL